MMMAMATLAMPARQPVSWRAAVTVFYGLISRPNRQASKPVTMETTEPVMVAMANASKRSAVMVGLMKAKSATTGTPTTPMIAPMIAARRVAVTGSLEQVSKPVMMATTKPVTAVMLSADLKAAATAELTRVKPVMMATEMIKMAA